MTIEGIAKTFTFEELDIDYTFGKNEPLRQFPMDRFDILRSATNNKKTIQETIEALATQYGHFIDRYFYHRSNEKYKYYPTAVKFLLGKANLPLPVLMTTQAILGYDCSTLISPRDFITNFKHYNPTLDEIKHFDLNESHLAFAANEPATLTGTAVITDWDGIDENKIYMRKVAKGPYKGKYTVGGGHADNISEIASLEEVIEEAGIPRSWVSAAKPIGAANQIVLVEKKDGSIGLRRYLNLVWEIPKLYNHQLVSNTHSPWEEVWDDDIPYLQREGMLTPIADYAIKTINI